MEDVVNDETMNDVEITNEEANEVIDEDVEVNKNDDKDDEKNVEKKEISCREKKWTCEDTPLWRVYMKSYLEQEKNLEKMDKFDQRQPAVLPRFPHIKSAEMISPNPPYHCLPLNIFNLEECSRLPEKLDRSNKLRIWRNMRNDPSVDTSRFFPEPIVEISRTDSGKWPGKWPCIARDLTGERKDLERKERRKKKGLLPCEKDSSDESDPEVPQDDFADRKELGHARVPISCLDPNKSILIDRSVGENPGLVDGNYVVLTFGVDAKNEGHRVHANVCLRGLKGMNLAELGDKRIRTKTWKFCFYQAVVALLAKTQLRYKFAWSVNIDYIFDHAWMLFVHMGSINVKEKIRLDDIVVYNYKYSVEIELVDEMKDAPCVESVRWNYAEKDLTNVREFKRPELMKTRREIGWEKPKARKSPAIHEKTRLIEKWFDKLPEIYRNCILRTSKFSLAFWKDGHFWYLYNPYRCDKFGLWDNRGYANIIKFCAKASLKRHIMVLILRAYSYEHRTPLKLARNPKENVQPPFQSPNETDGQQNQPETFTIQIYRMIYHCVQIHNVKLLQRKPPKPRMTRTKVKEIDDCEIDHRPFQDPCEENFEDDTGERSSWLKSFAITWARFGTPKNRDPRDENGDVVKLRWHQYYVEVPQKIFSLWGEIHPTGDMFSRENQGKQIRACYVIAAGMTRLQAPEYWSSKTLDAVITCGDRYYTMSKSEWDKMGEATRIDGSICREGHLGRSFKIGETLFEVRVLPDVCGRLYANNGPNLWRMVEQLFLRQHFGILTCESSCLGLFKFCGAYYMIDANSVGPPIFQYGDGVAYLMRAANFRQFMKILVLSIGSSECSEFFISPIVIDGMIDLGTSDPRDREGKREFRKFKCPYEDEASGSKKWKKQNGRKRTIDRVSCKKNPCDN